MFSIINPLITRLIILSLLHLEVSPFTQRQSLKRSMERAWQPAPLLIFCDRVNGASKRPLWETPLGLFNLLAQSRPSLRLSEAQAGCSIFSSYQERAWISNKHKNQQSEVAFVTKTQNLQKTGC